MKLSYAEMLCEGILTVVNKICRICFTVVLHMSQHIRHEAEKETFVDMVFGIAAGVVVVFLSILLILVHTERLILGLPIGLPFLLIGVYVLPPLADTPEDFFWVASLAIPIGGFGGLLCMLGLWDMIARFLHWRKIRSDGENHCP